MNALVELLYNPPAVIWPLIVFALLLIGLHQVKEQVNPVIGGIVKGLSVHAQQNAVGYGMAVMFGLSASLAAFYDLFSQVTKTDIDGMSWHQYMSLWAKVLNPFIVASLAYATKAAPSRPPSVNTNPPFPAPSQ